MIRVKTISIKQTLEKLIYILIILLVVLMISLIAILGIHILETKLRRGEMYFDYKMVSGRNLITNIIEKEMPLIHFSETISEPHFDKQITGTKKNEIKVGVTPVKKHYELPDKYDVVVYENGKIQIGNSKVTNYSKLQLDYDELAKVNKNISFDNSDFLIVHTHATECYTGDSDENSNYRTIKIENNMVSIGDAFKEELEVRGYDVAHDKTLHDYPDYNGSYQASLNTVQNYMKKHNYDFIFDIHRDALSSDLNYAPTIEVNNEKAAQMMFVVGTDACGLKHENWMENLKLAIMIQNRANEMYPGLFRDLNLSASRYNQHVSDGALIIEVGATGNTAEEAQSAVKLLADVIDSFNT